MMRAALADVLVESLCRLNHGAKQCRWLVHDHEGFLCAKHDRARRDLILERERHGALHAVGDNCNGIYPWIHSSSAHANRPVTSAYYDCDSMIFVFGSNKAGRHGRGAALHAVKFFGAMYGEGDGPTGRAYAIPTKDEKLRVLPLSEIEPYVERFIRYAHDHSALTFLVSAIGCGLAGYRPDQIAPMFAQSPENCYVSPRFILDGSEI